MNNSQKIFELYSEIQVENGCNEPRITKISPQNYNDEEVLKILGDFVFPCSRLKSSPVKSGPENPSPISFSFVLTNINKKYKYGFCRHSSPTSAIVLLTLHPWHDAFLKLLNVLSVLRQIVPEHQFDSYLSQIIQKSLPDEHKSTSLVFSDPNGVTLQEFSLERPLTIALSSIPENHNLNLFYNYIEPKTMVSVFSALMSERRVLFTSNNLDKLSSCVQASCSLLYPMYWQHIFIPLLPFKLKDYLLAPMPYCIGCPAGVFGAVRREEIGDVVVVDCDTNTVTTPFNDVMELPQDILSFLKKNLAGSLIGDRIPRVFLRCLVQIIGGYRDAVRYTERGLKFSNENFIESQSPQYRDFVQKMVELQVFQQFIEERLALMQSNSETTDIFEIEVELHEAKMGRRRSQYKEFIRNIKGKANPAVKNAVKSVKDTCKEIKSKIRENSSRETFNLKKSDKNQHRPVETFQFFDQNAHASKYLESSSTSSSSSPSDMNILQELEAQGMLSTADKGNESKDECNLIDLSGDSICDNIAKFDQLEVADNRISSHRNDPFAGSELLSDVMSELYRTNRNNWTTFE